MDIARQVLHRDADDPLSDVLVRHYHGHTVVSEQAAPKWVDREEDGQTISKCLCDGWRHLVLDEGGKVLTEVGTLAGAIHFARRERDKQGGPPEKTEAQKEADQIRASHGLLNTPLESAEPEDKPQDD